MRVVVALLVALAPLLVAPQALSGDTKPTAYELNITVPDLKTEDTYNGSVQINITVVTSTAKIELHAKNLIINSRSIKVLRSSPYSSTGWSEETFDNVSINGSVFTIGFQSPIPASDYLLVMDFQGNFQNSMAGFAKVPFHFNRNLSYLAVTSLEPANARMVFPCYDEPQHRTPFDLFITVNKTQIVLANVAPTSVKNATNTSKVFHFRIASIPVNRLGWAVMDRNTFLLRNTTTSMGVQVHTRALFPYSNHTAWASNVTTQLVDTFGNYTKIPYTLSKLEQVVVPEFFTDTAEGWGITSYSEESILVTPGRSSARDSQRVILELAKSIIQQWIGSMVSAESWDNTWMFKGLTEYLKYNITSSLPEVTSWELNEQLVLELVQPAFALDSSSEHALSDTATSETAYDDLTRLKGSAIVRMLHNVLGDAIFNNALAVYLVSNNGFTSTSQEWEDMMYIAAREAHVDLDMQSVNTLLSHWISSPGYPVLNVNWNGTHFNISQPASSHWYIPVTYMLQYQNQSTKVWLKPEASMVVPASRQQWILVNVNVTGFYRVNYNSTLLELLFQQLQIDMEAIPRLSRAQLIDDVFSLTNSEVLSFDTLLRFTGYLKKETDYYPWHTALRNYQVLLDRFYGHPAYPKIQDYVLKLLDCVITQVGLISSPQDTHIGKLKRGLVLEKACALGHSTCLQKATSLLHSWRAGTFFDPELNSVLLCAAVSNSTADVWHEVWEMYQYSVFPTVRANLLRALTCSSNSTLLKEFLTNISSTRTPVVSAKDRTILWKTLAQTPSGAHVFLEWLLDELYAQVNTSDVLSNTTASGSNSTNATVPEILLESDIMTIVSYIGPKLTTIEQGTKVEKFVMLNNTGLSNATLQVLQAMVINIYRQDTWARKYNGKVQTWLESSDTQPGCSKVPVTSPPPSSQPPGSTPSPSPSGATDITSSLALCILTLVLLRRADL